MTAVFGMNCAMPCAPARLMVLELKLLSAQIRFAKNGTGRLYAFATSATVRQSSGCVGTRGWAPTSGAVGSS